MNRQTKTKRPAARAAKPLPPGRSGQRPGTEPGEQGLKLPTEPAERRRAIKDAYVGSVGACVFAGQMRPFINFADKDQNRAARKAAEQCLAAITESVQPRDAIEELLVVQMVWTHARLARLSAIASNQTATANVRVVHEACDRAAATFRRQVQTLAEYRRPPRTDGFTVVKQLNAAQQQLVNNAQAENAAKPVASNELGCPPAQALPSHAEGIDFTATVGPTKQAVGMEHRTQDQGGEGPRQQERTQAR